ncbi:protocatechuate 3,4-dioxygenase subunit alpha [Anderseniella sp. Alg231-50]|uniref:protocatechuate 3,4-dioxygenase subunit alpha n=1 Tax=Anderseniella sp. Alg231-50 TaxID=1922226 RepID=UPI00307B12AF
MKETPSQTAGPYVHIGLLPAAAGIDVPGHGITGNTGLSGGTPVSIAGVVRDGAGDIVKDALLEIWQADGDGGFGDGHKGFARCHTDFETGEFRFETVKPGPVAWINGSPQAPHLTLMIYARGINIHLHTRIYFADEADANAADPVLNAIADGRETLLAKPDNSSNNSYRFDVSLQGEAETVFFDI